MSARTPTELAYMAGIIDGEGCVYVPKAGSKWPSPQVIVSNTDLELLAWVQARFGGRLYKASGRAPMNRERTKDCFVVKWQGGPATAAFLKPLLPYLIIKRVKAEAAIQRSADLRRHRIVTLHRSDPASDEQGRLAI